MYSSNGKETTQYFSQFGKIRKISDFELLNYTDGTEQDMGIFRFKVDFELARGIITVIVIEGDDGPRIHGININITSQKPTKDIERSA